MKKPNQIVQMDILGPFYLENSTHQKNYVISCEDDCSRKVASEWSERKRSIDLLDVLEDYIVEKRMVNPKKYCMTMVNSLHLKYSDIFYNVTTLKINPYLQDILNYKERLRHITK